MCRTVTLLIALAAFAAASAFGTPASSAKSRRRVSVGHAHHPRSGSETSRRAAHTLPVPTHSEAKSTANTTHRPTADEVGRAAGLKIRREMERHAAYRRRPMRTLRTRRARLVETARITRYPARRPVVTPVATFGNHPQVAMNTPSAQAFSPAQLKEAEERQYGSVQSDTATGSIGDTAVRDQSDAAVYATSAQRSAERTSGRLDRTAEAAPAATGAALPEAAVESSDDSPGAAADEPAPEPPADVRSESEVASLTIPHGAMPAPLRGSLASLERQNDRLTAEGLERIENEDDLAARIANHLLVPVPASDALVVNPALPPNHRYCRPWTARFVAELAREHEALFHRPLEISSAVRTVEYQRHLMRINGNAAPAEGDVVSPHLTGATIDIAKEGLTRTEINWMRRRLLQLEEAGKIDVEEEFQQSCFHITVYTTYAPAQAPRRAVHAHPGGGQPSAPVESADGDPTEGL